MPNSATARAPIARTKVVMVKTPANPIRANVYPITIGAESPPIRPKAEATRRAFYDRVIAEKAMIDGYHFGFPNVGTLARDGNGYAFADVKA